MAASDTTAPFAADPPSDEHLQAIGLAIHNWNVVHLILGYAVCSLVAQRADFHTDDTAPAVLTTGMSSRTLIGVLKTLARMRFPDHADGFAKLTDDLNKANRQRDVFAHAVWVAGSKPGTIEPMLAKTVGSLRKAGGALTAEEIRAHANQFILLGAALLGFLWKWDLAPEPFGEIFGPPDPP